MGPSLKNFVELLLPREHDPLKMNTRNRKIIQLIAIAEDGKLPPSFNRLDWIGTPLSRMAYPDNQDNRTGDELQKIAATLQDKIYPDIRTGADFKIKLLEQKQKHLNALKKGTDTPVTVRRAVPSLPNGRAKRTPSL